MISHMRNLKYNPNEPMYKTETDSENRLAIAKGERVGEEMAERLG